MQKLPKCRKHIRKKHRLLISYKKKSDKCKWLSTHLWATKRMKMINYFNYKIAFTPNDKSFRSAYRHFRHNACLLDLSYFECLKINLNASELDKFIKINNFS